MSLLVVWLSYSFIVCCVVSAALQIFAWSRHSRGLAAPSLKALWRPEGYFDEIGLRQIRLARLLLIVGVVAYLSSGLLHWISSTVFRAT